MSGKRTSLAATLATLALLNTNAANWPEYRGPNHNGTTSEAVSKWSGAGPKAIWKTPLTAGFSSIAVDGSIAATLVTRTVEGAPREVCVALDAATGKELWATPLAVAKYDGGGDSGTPDNKGGDGPRSTPTINSGHVYAIDARLNLVCLDSKTGARIWAKDIVKEHSGQNITWQDAASPVIEGDLIFMAGGGAGQALLGIDKNTGKTIWKAEDDKMTHATPVMATIHGVRQVVFFTQKGLVSLEPESGKLLWRYPFQYSTSTAASPVIAGDIAYCSAGYNVGSGAARITKNGDTFEAKEIWRTKGNKNANHWSTPVEKDGYLYGMFSFKEYGSGAVKCIELATAREVWSQPNFGSGQAILAGGKLVALSDSGQIVLIDPTPEGYKEICRMQAVAGKCWSTPTLSEGHLYVRSTKEGACYDVSVKVAGTR
jgi:outer membrane protein assembly factor BamB